jgi:purine nucleosidase/pyrimidine-specific ribonucleoside hydrolase
MPGKIIIDTDIGDDIDDALAIALALKSPELDLVGVTCVFRDTVVRAALATKLLRTFGRGDIPVAVGIGQPLREPVQMTVPNQAVVLTDEDRRGAPVAMDAVDLILSTVARHPGEITLVPIGALTNVAVAIAKDCTTMRKLAGIALMGGRFLAQGAEWNIKCDPEAADIVFRSGIPILAVGLDVTLKCRMGEPDVARIRDAGRAETALLARMIEAWQGGQKNRFPTLHDPLAVAAVYRPELMTWQKKVVKVETAGIHTRAFTVIADPPKEGTTTQIAAEVKKEEFLRLFLDRVTG